MSGGHTPGPWQVNGTRHSGDLKIGRDARLHFVGPDGDAVAAVFFDMKTGRGWKDAKLIAAAPEMLNALNWYADRLCEGWCEKSPDCAHFEDCAGCLARRTAYQATGAS